MFVERPPELCFKLKLPLPISQNIVCSTWLSIILTATVAWIVAVMRSRVSSRVTGNDLAAHCCAKKYAHSQMKNFSVALAPPIL